MLVLVSWQSQDLKVRKIIEWLRDYVAGCGGSGTCGGLGWMLETKIDI